MIGGPLCGKTCVDNECHLCGMTYLHICQMELKFVLNSRLRSSILEHCIVSNNITHRVTKHVKQA